MTKQSSPTLSARPIIYFDGGCALCRREIALYRRRPGMEEAIDWRDITLSDAAPAPDLSREVAMARFHMRKTDGTLISGAKAFIALWQMMPGFRWLGRLTATPPIPAIAEVAYRGFLKLRPLMVPRSGCEAESCAPQSTGPAQLNEPRF